MNKSKCAFLLLTAVLLTGLSTGIYAQVNEEELRQDLPPVIFLNFQGPYARIDTREQIRQIGAELGSIISGNVERAGSTSRYYIIHSVSAPEDNKLDADIFGLGVDAGVSHIRNLRTIIQGYLQEAYNYSERDAALLAEYITIYNAVYRGNWEYFSSRYKTLVMRHLVRERAGISIRYDEWPGRTMMLIPLGRGGLSSVDTAVISDRAVLDELRKDDDMGIDQRRDMVDLKEREADEAEQIARIEREAIRDEEREITREREEIVQERERTQEDREAGRITEEEARQRDRETDRREEAAEERERELDQRRDEVQRLEDFAEQKAEEAQQDRRTIAEDQQTTIIADTRGGIFGIAIERTDSIFGRIVRINNEGRQLRRSQLDTIHARTVTFIGGKILAIAGENTRNSAVRLIEVNQDSLEIARQGNDDILPGSLLWVNGNDLYAITIDLNDNSCYLGRFNIDLALQAKSRVKLHTGASVTIQQGQLLTQREDGSVLILNPVTLNEVWQQP